MRRVLIPLLLAAFVTFPAAREAWRNHQIDSKGREVVPASVYYEHPSGRGYFVTYQLPHDIDSSDKKVAAVVDKAAFDRASAGKLMVRVVPGSTLSAPDGEVRSPIFAWMAAFGDALIAAFVVIGWRRRRRWSRLAVSGGEVGLVTITVAGLSVLAEAPPGVSVGDVLRGELGFEPEDDVLPGATTTGIAHLGDGRYRVTGRVRSARSDGFTEMLLERGMPLRISSEEINHQARPKELGTVVGRFVVKPR